MNGSGAKSTGLKLGQWATLIIKPCQQIEIKNCSNHSEVSNINYTYQHHATLKQTSNKFPVKISVKMNVYVLDLRKSGSH